MVGSRFGEAGMRELAVQSDVVAEGSMEKVIRDKHYTGLCAVIKLCMKR